MNIFIYVFYLYYLRITEVYNYVISTDDLQNYINMLAITSRFHLSFIYFVNNGKCTLKVV